MMYTSFEGKVFNVMNTEIDGKILFDSNSAILIRLNSYQITIDL